MASISLSNLSKRWGKVYGARNINLDIADQEFIVFKTIALSKMYIVRANSIHTIRYSSGKSEGKVKRKREAI